MILRLGEREIQLMYLGRAHTAVPGHGPVGGKTAFAEAQEPMALLDRETRRGFDAG
jgi:hypothetical protein